MQKQEQWPFGSTKQYPYAFIYQPALIPAGEDFLNPFLGYPNCPLIGRYNGGQYRIADTKCHLQFRCQYDQKQGIYKCGASTINIPLKMIYNLRNIPQIIKHNKPPGQANNKKIQDVHPLKFPILNQVKFIFVLTFGQIGKDFLNYLNHMYTLAQDLFIDQKLRRSVFMLPIYAYLPEKSGIMEEQVDKGLSLQNYRSQFFSLHLKYGAPAFSPNNMRLGIQGMKKVVSNPPGKKQQKYVQKNQNQQSLDSFLYKKQNKQNNEKQHKISENNEDLSCDLFDEQAPKNEHKIEQKKKPQPYKNQKYQNKSHQGKNKNQPSQHKGFVHFYTSVLLENDYRVYYHWHIDNRPRRQLIQAALNKSASVIEFISRCKDLLGEADECVKEICRLFGVN